MINSKEDVVPVASGTLVEMNLLADEFKAAGILCKVVGDELTAGLGTTLPGTVELWVTSSHVEHAKKLILASESHHTKYSKPSHEKFPHPESDPKIDRAHAQHPSPQDHRKSM